MITSTLSTFEYLDYVLIKSKAGWMEFVQSNLRQAITFTEIMELCIIPYSLCPYSLGPLSSCFSTLLVTLVGMVAHGSSL
uniref:Uncharacterized protein n=1 Tax=Rhizophora mucronata TaxID=61149 RepID=A0A2P2QLE7_RHIMU